MFLHAVVTWWRIPLRELVPRSKIKFWWTYKNSYAMHTCCNLLLYVQLWTLNLTFTCHHGKTKEIQFWISTENRIHFIPDDELMMAASWTGSLSWTSNCCGAQQPPHSQNFSVVYSTNNCNRSVHHYRLTAVCIRYLQIPPDLTNSSLCMLSYEKYISTTKTVL